MLRHELIVTSIRLYKDPQAGYWAKADVKLNVRWLDHKTVAFSEFTGHMTYHLWRELLDWAKDLKVEVIHAEREPGHVLPCEWPSQLGVDWRMMWVDELLKRYRHKVPHDV